jgi:hypothetical protein
MTLHLLVHCETVWDSESKECLGDVCTTSRNAPLAHLPFSTTVNIVRQHSAPKLQLKTVFSLPDNRTAVFLCRKPIICFAWAWKTGAVMAFWRWLVRCARATGNVGSCGAAGYRDRATKELTIVCASLQSSNNWLPLSWNRQLKADSELTNAMPSNTDIYFVFLEANNPTFSSPCQWTRHNIQYRCLLPCTTCTLACSISELFVRKWIFSNARHVSFDDA